MNLLRKIKVAVIIFALATVLVGSLYMTAYAKKCLLICYLDPVYECKIVCYK